VLAIALTLTLLQPLPAVSIADTDLELNEALTIPMGDYLPAIKADRLVIDHEILITLDVNSWLRVKDVVLGQGNICELAVETAANVCEVENERALKEVRAEAQQQTAEDRLLIDALKRQLNESELAVKAQTRRGDHLKWALISVSAVTTVVTSIMIVQMYD
jgi:hypothetical protein